MFNRRKVNRYAEKMKQLNTLIELDAKLVNGDASGDYEEKIVAKIREKYSLSEELAILRQRDTKPSEFAEYNSYVEECKTKVKSGTI